MNPPLLITTFGRAKVCKQGFIYHYRYYDDEGNHKSIISVNFDILKEKVLSKGLLWEKFEDSICEEV